MCDKLDFFLIFSYFHLLKIVWQCMQTIASFFIKKGEEKVHNCFKLGRRCFLVVWVDHFYSGGRGVLGVGFLGRNLRIVSILSGP